MSIVPLPQFESDRAEARLADQKIYDALRPPSSVVIRFGVMKLVGEFPYRGDAKPGCGSKMVAETHRGLEMGEMLTSTCPNAGCSKSVTRKEMLQYIENSGGRDYPFFTKGRVLRVATAEDMAKQSKLDQEADGMRRRAQDLAREQGLEMKFVAAEPILGGELLTLYYTSEDRVDFRDLLPRLASAFDCRIDLRQVGARDEARLVADYEKCGQHCCCKQFLKVLKPVSMRSAKQQKASLDPLKISGRCGRLMCCLRYEDQTYADLQKRLPRRKAKVSTPHGEGVVVDTQILTQLVLVSLDESRERVAVPVEEIGKPGEIPKASDPMRGAAKSAGRGERDRSEKLGQQEAFRAEAQRVDPATATGGATESESKDAEGTGGSEGATKPKRKRKRKRAPSSGPRDLRAGGAAEGAPKPKKPGDGGGPAKGAQQASSGSAKEGGKPSSEGRTPPDLRKKRSRRPKRRPDGEGGAGEGAGGTGGTGGGSDG